AAGEDGVEIRDAGPGIVHLYGEELRRALALDRELDLSAARIAEGVARDLGHRGGDAHLVLRVEADQRRDLSRPLPRAHDVVLVAQGDGHDADGHRTASSLRTAATMASSLPRAWSR